MADRKKIPNVLSILNFKTDLFCAVKQLAKRFRYFCQRKVPILNNQRELRFYCLLNKLQE